LFSGGYLAENWVRKEVKSCLFIFTRYIEILFSCAI